MKAFEKIINSIMEYARLNLSGVELETIEKAAKNGHAEESIFSSSPLAEAVAEARAEIFRQESKSGKETEVSRDHAENQEPEEKDAANESEIVATVPEMSTKTIRFYYNGLKANGGKLVRAFYHMESGQESPYVSISVRDYSGSLPRDCFVVKNDSDPYMDYYDTDRATITPEHPLYPYARAAAIKAATRKEPEYITELEEGLDAPERWPGRHEALRNDIASRRARYDALTAELETLPKGHPTPDDLQRVALLRQTEETERLRREHEERLHERERMLNTRNNGREYIKKIAAEYPMENGAPHVVINWSEYPAFYSWNDNELQLSVAAAEIILAHFDREVCKEKQERGEGGYYKTSFTIHYTDDNGKECTYEGRYDLGDNDGGMIQHIRSFGEYYQKHGKNDDDRNGGAEIIQFADAMQAHTVSGQAESKENGVKIEFVPWLVKAAQMRKKSVEDIFTAVKMLTDEQIISAIAMQDPKDKQKKDVARFFFQELLQRDKETALETFTRWESGELAKEYGAV